jgi:hypothetical protein
MLEVVWTIRRLARGIHLFNRLDWLRHRALNLKKAVAGLKKAHLPKITSAFEFSVLTLTVPGLRLRKVQNPLCLCAIFIRLNCSF